jgi:CDP-diacylglycerol--glycerol-3-phosphate 3-phosphatidyltransferase
MSDPTKLYFSDKILASTILRIIPQGVRPNYVTVLRFILTPLVVFLLFKESYRSGLVLFVCVAFTDALDGALARSRNLITDWGKMYDPLADKLLICSVIYVLVIKYLNLYLAFSVMILEIVIIIFGVLKRKQGSSFQANWWGKTKMISQVLGVSCLLLALILHLSVLVHISSIIFTCALILGLVSLFTYSL